MSESIYKSQINRDQSEVKIKTILYIITCSKQITANKITSKDDSLPHFMAETLGPVFV